MHPSPKSRRLSLARPKVHYLSAHDGMLGELLVILTDEFCHWASNYTPYVLHNKSKASLFLESTWGLNLASNMLVDGVASQRASSDSRSREW